MQHFNPDKALPLRYSLPDIAGAVASMTEGDPGVLS
jgi:hypothetical protein